ncbi:MAG: class I SAM-dependent methyltransferase [Chloroflexota bacterium]
MASILWTQSRGAPWVPTSLGKVQAMLAMAEVGPNDLVYDLGCGDGRTLVAAAWTFGACAVGIEIDPLRYLWCQVLITVLGLRGRVKIIFGDFFAQDLSPADVVTCYLTQSTNERLQDKFMQELHPTARLVSNDFTFPKLQLVRQNNPARIYLYHPVPVK